MGLTIIDDNFNKIANDGYWENYILIAEGKCSNTVSTAYIDPSWKVIKCLKSSCVYYVRNKKFNLLNLLLLVEPLKYYYASIHKDEFGEYILDNEDCYQLHQVRSSFEYKSNSLFIPKGLITFRGYAMSKK